MDAAIDIAAVALPVVEGALDAGDTMADRPDDDAADNETAGLEHAARLRRVEAILFAASEPVTEAAIGKRMGRDADVVGLLHELAERYATRGVNVVKVGDKWTLRTAPDLAPRLKLPLAASLSNTNST